MKTIMKDVSFDVHRVYHIHERLVNLRTDYNLRLKTTVTMSNANAVSSQQSTMKVRPELDDVTLRYVKDLLAWVEENQRRIDDAEWGSDLASVESQLGSHRGLNQTVEDFRSKIERARADEVVPLWDHILSRVLSILKLNIVASFMFFRASCLLSARSHTKNTWVNWTFSMPNYWWVFSYFTFFRGWYLDFGITHVNDLTCSCTMAI